MYFPVPETIWSRVNPLIFLRILVTWFSSRTLQITKPYIRFFICMSSFIFRHNILSCKMFCHNINIQMVFYFFEFFYASLYSDFLQISCHNMNMHKVFFTCICSFMFLQILILCKHFVAKKNIHNVFHQCET